MTLAPAMSFVAEKDTARKALRLNGFAVLRILYLCFSALFSSHFRTPILTYRQSHVQTGYEKRAMRQHSPLSYFSLMICSYSIAYFFSITMLLW